MDAVVQQSVMIVREVCPGCGRLPITYMTKATLGCLS